MRLGAETFGNDRGPSAAPHWRVASLRMTGILEGDA